MRISIIIVSYNTLNLTGRCIKSVAQSTKHIVHSEIIVVDNGSDDGSVEMVRKHKIILIENKNNLGFAKAVNQALRQAQGETILLLNSDTRIEKDAVDKLLDFEEKVGPAIIGAKLILPDGSIQHSVFHFPTIKRAINEFWLGRKGDYSNYAPVGDEASVVDAVVGGAMLISRKIIEEIGYFDERYFMYFEDLDYCRKANKAGYKVYYLPSSQIVHEHGASGRGLKNEENQWKRLIPSSKIYNGILKHYMIYLIMRLRK